MYGREYFFGGGGIEYCSPVSVFMTARICVYIYNMYFFSAAYCQGQNVGIFWRKKEHGRLPRFGLFINTVRYLTNCKK